jgi:hypothetical protein
MCYMVSENLSTWRSDGTLPELLQIFYPHIVPTGQLPLFSCIVSIYKSQALIFPFLFEPIGIRFRVSIFDALRESLKP